MPNPLVETQAFLAADLPNMPAGTTRGTAFPASTITGLYVQYAWDGTPSDADNREDVAVRVTVWAPRRVVDGKTVTSMTEAPDAAAGIRARFLRWSSPTCWRVDRGAGRLAGVDPDTALPFCSFTVYPVLHAVTA